MPSKLQHLIMASGFLAFVGFAGPVAAQEMGDDNPTETPQKPDAEKPAEGKTDEKPAKRERPARGERPASRSGELAKVLRTNDQDGDMKLSADELGDAELHKKLDTDGDGLLTLQEMLADQAAVIAAANKAAKAALEEEFKILDRDDSGKLSKEELGTNFGGLLETGDTDKDGSLSLDEFVKAKESKADAQRPGREGDRPARGADLDKDGDGKISKEEAPERLKAAFDELDADKDGLLSQEELQAARKKMQRPERKRPADGEKPAETEKPAESK